MDPAAPSTCAAQYLRMSTDSQRYSIERQTIANAAYAAANGIQIVRSYVDAGLSGLTLDRRDGLKQLLADVIAGQTEFTAILVCDVSRWGRFQDPDEAAHYEYICKAAGVRVLYCEELFENDGSFTSGLLKQIKRAMAADYSRDLSNRMAQTKSGLGRKGFWMGGSPGYGLRRCQIDSAGVRRPYLEDGELSPRVGHRTIIVPGPAEEVAIVWRIYRMFTSQGHSPPKIAKILNAERIPFRHNGLWKDNHIRTILRNELYIGNMVFGRDRTHLGVCEKQPAASWVRVKGACDPILPIRTFERAQRMAIRFRHRSKEELLDTLRALLAAKGRLSSALIQLDPASPDPNVYRFHFGSLTRAYELIGYVMTPDQQALCDRVARYRGKGHGRRGRASDDEVLRRLKDISEEHGTLNLALIGITPGVPGRSALVRRFGSIERAYALVGHVPGERQRQCFAREALRRGVDA